MKRIDHLPKSEQQHFMLCDCGEYMDMRNLADVFTHMHNGGLPDVQWSYARKIGEPAIYPKKGGKIDLN